MGLAEDVITLALFPFPSCFLCWPSLFVHLAQGAYTVLWYLDQETGIRITNLWHGNLLKKFSCHLSSYMFVIHFCVCCFQYHQFQFSLFLGFLDYDMKVRGASLEDAVNGKTINLKVSYFSLFNNNLFIFITQLKFFPVLVHCCLTNIQPQLWHVHN